jgi:hypothetical protein
LGAEFAAPILVAPLQNQLFSPRDTIALQWQPVGQLAPDEYYEVVVAYSPIEAPGQTWYDDTPWTKSTSWNLSDHPYLVNLSSDGVFRWAVRVMRRTGINDQGRPAGIARSPMSEVRTLTWRASGGGGGGGGGTPEPPPP